MARGEVPFKEWWRNTRKSTQFSTYFKEDTAPFWQHVRNERKVLIRALAHRFIMNFRR